jgi:Domain of unknown function (DUF2470)
MMLQLRPNADHKDALILLVSRFASIDAHEAEDDFGRWSRFPRAPENQDGVKGIEIAFVREVIDPSQTRQVFVEM